MSSTALAYWASLALAIAGFACLGAAMLRHAHDVFGRDATPVQAWSARGTGSALLAVALALCIRAEGLSVGIAAWLGILTPAALLVGLGFTALAGRRKPGRRGGSQASDR